MRGVAGIPSTGFSTWIVDKCGETAGAAGFPLPGKAGSMTRADRLAQALRQDTDGLEAIDSLVDGAWQYALTRRGEIMRRPAAYARSYGGWRWECSLSTCLHYPSVYPALVARFAPLAAAG